MARRKKDINLEGVDQNEAAYNSRFKTATAEIEKFVTGIGVCTYARIARELPAHADILTDVLLDSKKIIYDPNEPAPSRVRSHRAAGRQVEWTSNTTEAAHGAGL